MPFEDIHFQLVDLPAVSPEHPVPWLASALQMADAALLVVDLSAPSCIDAVGAVQALLRERRVYLIPQWGAPTAADGPEEGDPFALRLPTLLLANKVDEVADAAAELEVLRELAGITLPMLPISAATGRGLAEIGALAVPRTRRRPRLHQAAGQAGRPRAAVHAAPRADGARRRPAGAQGSRALAALRARHRPRRLRGPARRSRARGQRRRRGRAARLKRRALRRLVAIGVCGRCASRRCRTLSRRAAANLAPGPQRARRRAGQRSCRALGR